MKKIFIMKNFVIISLLFGIMYFTPTYAIVEQTRDIKEINEVVQSLETLNPKETIAVFDFDQTISNDESEIKAPREENPQTGTIATIEMLQKSGIKVIIITSRNWKKESAEKQAELMKELLGDAWKKENVLDSKKAFSIQKIKIVDDIIFTAGADKGEVLEKLINNNVITINPTNIVFVDNDLYKVMDVMNSFWNRKEKMYVFYYPTEENSKVGQELTETQNNSDSLTKIKEMIIEEKK